MSRVVLCVNVVYSDARVYSFIDTTYYLMLPTRLSQNFDVNIHNFHWEIIFVVFGCDLRGRGQFIYTLVTKGSKFFTKH